MHRGARQAPVFLEDADCVLLLDTLAEAVELFQLEVHAYSLMPNHYHLLVRTPLGNLSRAMRHLNGVYTQRINRRHQWAGPAFRGRFRSQLVTHEAYRRELVAYLHLHPVRAHFVGHPDEACWTSHRCHVGLDPAPSWLCMQTVRDTIGSPSQLQAFVRDRQLGRQPWPDGMDIETGWNIAPPSSALVNEDVATTAPVSTKRLVGLLAEVTGTNVSTLLTAKRGPGAAPERRFAAIQLARQPHLSHRQVAHALNMSPRQVSNLQYRAKTAKPNPQSQAWAQAWKERLDSEI